MNPFLLKMPTWFLFPALPDQASGRLGEAQWGKALYNQEVSGMGRLVIIIYQPGHREALYIHRHLHGGRINNPLEVHEGFYAL